MAETPKTPLNTQPSNSGAVNKPTGAKPSAPRKPVVKLGTLSPSGKQAYLKSRGKMPTTILILKYISIVLFALTWVSYFIIRADLDPQNTYLRLFAVSENTYLKHKNLAMRAVELQDSIKEYEENILDYTSRLDERSFFEHQTEINDIKSNSTIQWFDKINEDGEFQPGVIDSLEKLTNFFNARNYNNTEGKGGKITGRQILSRNDVEISNISVDRDNANFSVSGSNIFGKVFFLNTELVEMVNAFPFFKNGELRNFSRQQVRGNEGMEFSLSVDIQQPDEEDPADVRFIEFLDWQQQENSRSSIPAPTRLAPESTPITTRPRRVTAPTISTPSPDPQ